MRKLLVVIIIVVAVLVWVPGLREKIWSAIDSSMSGLTAPSATQPQGNSVTKVYILRDGPYYHLGDCPQIAGKTPVVMTLLEAKELYQPCPICKPPH